jgi:hypothetical protein
MGCVGIAVSLRRVGAAAAAARPPGDQQYLPIATTSGCRCGDGRFGTAMCYA